MTSKSMAFRFPEALAQVIESRARATGRDKTTVVVEALTQAFGLPLSTPAKTTIEALHEQLSQLESQIAIFSEQIVELRQTAHADENILRLIAALERTISASTIRSDTCNGDSKANNPLETVITVANQKLGGNPPESRRDPENRQLYHQQSQTLESIFLATPESVFAYDRIGRLTYVNPAGGRMLGLERSQLLGRTCQELGLASDSLTQYLQKRETVFTTGRPLKGEISIPSGYESTRSYEYTLTPIQPASGSVDAVLCTARDITERQQAEIALQESEATYRNLFESTNDSILVVDASTRRIMNANWNAARRLGYTRSELLQMSETEIAVSSDPTRTKDIFRELLATGSVTFEHLQRCKDGTLIPVESSSQAIEYEGRLAIQIVTRDIRERKRAELALRESEAYHRSLLANSTDMISCHSPEGSYLYLSSACHVLLGYAPPELVGQSAYELIHPQDRAALQECHAIVLSSTATHTVSYRIRRKDNSYVWFESTCRAILDPETGAVQEMIAVSRITVRREAQEKCTGCSHTVEVVR